MAQQNVNGATSKPTAASALKNGGRSDQQVYELFLAVQRACGGRSTGTSEPPSVPADAEYLVIDQGGFDSLAVWLVEGVPVAASDEMNLTHWLISAGQ